MSHVRCTYSRSRRANQQMAQRQGLAQQWAMATSIGRLDWHVSRTLPWLSVLDVWRHPQPTPASASFANPPPANPGIAARATSLRITMSASRPCIVVHSQLFHKCHLRVEGKKVGFMPCESATAPRDYPTCAASRDDIGPAGDRLDLCPLWARRSGEPAGRLLPTVT